MIIFRISDMRQCENDMAALDAYMNTWNGSQSNLACLLLSTFSSINYNHIHIVVSEITIKHPLRSYRQANRREYKGSLRKYWAKYDLSSIESVILPFWSHRHVLVRDPKHLLLGNLLFVDLISFDKLLGDTRSIPFSANHIPIWFRLECPHWVQLRCIRVMIPQRLDSIYS